MTPDCGRSVTRLHDLSGRVALISGGAGSGFAAAMVAALAEAGAQVVLTARRRERAEEAATRFREQGWAVAGCPLELGDEGTLHAAVDFATERFGGLDILVNAAAAIDLAPVESIPLESFNRILALNVGGTMALSRAAAAAMEARGGGSIVNLSSIYGGFAPDPRIYGDTGLNSPLVYGASKAAIEQMTRYLAVHWRPRIRVNCIAPGGLLNGQGEEFVEAYCSRTPLGRMGEREDIKGALLFLASDASRWVTGEVLHVDGGWGVW